MKKFLIAILAGILGAIGLAGTSSPVFADECVETAILGDGGQVCDSGSGDSIVKILISALDIASVLVGVVAAIGITVVGIQYMTAADNEQQVMKSKRRMYEIVIGVALYFVIYALMKWLLPDYNPSSSYIYNILASGLPRIWG